MTDLATLFTDARTQQGWLPREVSDEQIKQLYDNLKWAPTAYNASPARFVFVKSAAQKELLAACAAPGNAPKIIAAPVTVIVGMDLEFYAQLPLLAPQVDADAAFKGRADANKIFALRNSSLQGGYLILAARALGLDAGPMSGFNTEKVDAAFFAGTSVTANFICSLGHGDPEKLRPRAPRLPFDDACRIV